MKVVTIIGSHGYNGRYGGWDQLVNMLVKFNDRDIFVRIISPHENQNSLKTDNVEVINAKLSGSGLKGLVLDICSSLIYAKSTDTYLLLGAKGIPGALIAKLFFGTKIVVNAGGIEWERPQYNKLIKLYLKFCFKMAEKFSDHLILDNEYYLKFVSKKTNNIKIIPYGGEIYTSLDHRDVENEYDFINKKYFLSVSRSIKDNMIYELCTVFKKFPEETLVLISNLSNSTYGRSIIERFGAEKNIILIDGLYDKEKLDCIRRNCFRYIHTHTLCGSAPSLIEMIVAGKPIISIDRPQNRYTLQDKGMFFEDFEELQRILNNPLTPSDLPLAKRYNWQNIIMQYQKTF